MLTKGLDTSSASSLHGSSAAHIAVSVQHIPISITGFTPICIFQDFSNCFPHSVFLVVTVHLVSMDPASGTIGLPDVSVPESGADPRLCVRLDLAGGLTIARTVSVTLSTVAGGTAQGM